VSDGVGRFDFTVSVDAARWSPDEPEPTPFRSTRDGRWHYSWEAVDHVEETNCARGCRWGAAPGSPEDREFGPGGTCHVLARISLGDGDPIPELDDRGDRVVCLVREPASVVSCPVAARGPPVPGQLALLEV
jgi:hypothetical protein